MATGDKLVNLDSLKTAYNTSAKFTAPMEASSTASAAHATGEYFIFNGLLYVATSDIASGATITPNTNCRAVPGGTGGEVSDLKSAITLNVEWINGYYISAESGNAVAHEGYKVTDFIPIHYAANKLVLWYKLRLFNATAIAYYDENKTLVDKWAPDSGSLIVVNGVTNAPETAFYVRFTCEVSFTPTIILNNVVVNVGYKMSVEEMQGAHDPTTNFINYNTIKRDSYINEHGIRKTTTNVGSTDYIAVSENTRYYYGNLWQTYYAFYNENKQLVASYSTLGNLNGSYFDTPAGTAFARFTILLTRIDSREAYISLDNLGLPDDYAYHIDGTRSVYGTQQIANGAITKEKIATKAVGIDALSFAEHAKNTNYIPTDMEWLSNSYINSSGTISTFSGLYATPYIELEEDTTYYTSQLYSGYYAFYSADYSVIEAHDADTTLQGFFTTPHGTKYGRFTNANGNIDSAWIALSEGVPNEYGIVLKNCYVESTADDYSEHPCDYPGNDISAFTKCLCIGDSLTAGTMNNNNGDPEYINMGKYSWPANLARLTGIETTNWGIGGRSSAEWYQDKSSADWSGYDVAIIQLGVNDQIRYGSFGNTTITAMTNIISKLKTDNKNIKIFIANIIPARSYANAGYLQFSSDLLAWVTILNQTDSDIIPLDIQSYGHTKSNDAYNCGHLSAYGYWRLAQDYKNYISYYMNTHKSVFKEIQFVGTDYWYDNPNQ